ncbi:DUF1707 domain-containing protein [Glycomyces sp. L485]|uniref:DUF1707 SHOCT-like domain-containing protein n=1 Tax=Glycomyces sp. L485 TaxID=2909235 RepID=UPI001F4B58B1|nr:DUF1707 domain-containing protein [Glycomyces sp. L485]MCH7229330.1 DUF1707 domain-containing protein [Glycomyces sp. L485]
MDRDQMRASESDRQLVMDRLRQAVEDGRLDVAEYQQRIDAAMSAKVYSELDVLLADLQRLPPPGFQDSQPIRATTPIRPTVSRANERLREDMAARNRKWKTAGVVALIAAGVSTVLIVAFPQLLLYIAITVLVVLILFVLAGVLGLF